MKKGLLLIAIVAMLLPMSMMAQTTLVLDKESGLEYLDDGDGRLYIDVGSTAITTIKGTPSNQYFVSDGGLRSNWRQNIPDERLKNKAKWYKEYLDEIKTFDKANNGPTTFKGIEYFRNLESLTIPMTGNNNAALSLDLSKNTKLSSLIWNLGPQIKKLTYINVSNTQLTTLPLPNGANANLKTIVAENSKLSTLNLSSLSALETVNLENSTSLTELIPATNSLASLNLRGCTGLATTYTTSNPLDLTTCAVLDRFGVKVLGSNLVIGESVLVNENLAATVLDINAQGEDVNLNAYTNLKTLTCRNARELDVSALSNLETLNIRDTTDTKLILSKDNIKLETLDITYSGVTKVDLSGDVPGTSGTPETCWAPNLVTFRAFFCALEELNLSWHTKLKSAPYPTTGNDPNNAVGLRLIPIPKSLAYRGLANTVEDVDEYNKNNKLRKVTLKGCTELSILSLTFGQITSGYASNDHWIYYNSIDSVDVSGSSSLENFYCFNSMLKYLNLSNCNKLRVINMDQGMLTGLNHDINLSGCDSLKTFIAKRHQWRNLDFLLKERSADEIFQLNQIQVNGGSYTLRTPDGLTKYIRKDNDSIPIKYTCRLKDIDLSKLNPGAGRENPNLGNKPGTGEGFRRLLVDCNLLTQLDLSVIGPCLEQLQCTNNMLTTLDLTNLNSDIDHNSCNWRYQVGYLNAEIVKGHWDGNTNKWMDFPDPATESRESGLYDWVALHMVNGGFTHRMDNDFGLYPNLYCARKDTLRIAKAAIPWMCKVSEVNVIKDSIGGEKFKGSYPCPTGHTGQHIFLHSQDEITEDFGKFKDQDLTGTVMTYKYNTGFRQRRDKNLISPDDLDNYSLSGLEKLPVGVQDTAHIIVRMHLFPYLLNINPMSKDEFSATKLDSASLVTYFSSTLILDYDALIPPGITCYTISGRNQDSRVFEVRGTAIDGQINIVPFGGEKDPHGNWILPAKTAVYVRADKPNPAGLYAFQPIHEIELQGWENLRGETDQDDYLLHGMENLNSSGVKEEYSDALTLAQNRLKEGGINYPNILKGYLAPKYEDENDTIDINHKLYNITAKGKETDPVKPYTVLALGVQNQTSAWPVIGFWPYRGSALASNRCYIDYYDIYPDGAPVGGAKGFNFFFVGEEKEENEVTGVKEINDKWLNATEGWYNMQGVRLNGEPTQPGVYIFNGKKVTIKR